MVTGAFGDLEKSAAKAGDYEFIEWMKAQRPKGKLKVQRPIDPPLLLFSWLRASGPWFLAIAGHVSAKSAKFDLKWLVV